MSLCELHPLLRLEHNSINQAALKQTSRVLLATITFIGKDTNALRKLSFLYQLGQYHHIGTIGWRGNYALHQPLPIGQHVLFVPVAIVPAFAHLTSFRVHPWFATFELILISLLLGLLFFGAQVLAVVCHFDEDTSIGSVRPIHNTRIHDSSLVNTANSVLLELLIQLAKELVHNPQARQFSAKATDGAVVWSWKAHIQGEEFAEEEGVVDPFFDLVITQALPGLKQ